MASADELSEVRAELEAATATIEDEQDAHTETLDLLNRERVRVGDLEKANEMLEEDRKREKARADAAEKDRQYEVKWHNETREALAAARRECDLARGWARIWKSVAKHSTTELRELTFLLEAGTWPNQKAALAAPAAGEEGKHGQ